jgi:hypothetical protein
MSTLEHLNSSFRHQWLSYQQLTEQLHQWQNQFPSIFQLQSLGQTEQGREIWLVCLNAHPTQVKPALWVDANMHASELAGSSVALAIIEDWLRLLSDPSWVPAHLPPTLCAIAREIQVFVVPRVCPDGAEQVLTTGAYCRSNPRDRQPATRQPYWRIHDLNHDQRVVMMRREHPSGDFVASSEHPSLMFPRRLEDLGPFYHLFPEGSIENYDGIRLPDSELLSDNDTDLNRNFPWNWVPDHQQYGAGLFPGSDLESRSIIEFTSAHPEIFAWYNLHTFGGVMIRPLGDQGDAHMNRFDLAVFTELAEIASTITKYPTVSGYEEFLYEPMQSLRGALSDYAYHQRGCVALVCELWDLFQRLGIARKKPFINHYNHWSRDDSKTLARWDHEHNHDRAFQPWVPFDHPQLGKVEIGGIDPRVGLVNPTWEALPEICDQQAQFAMNLGGLAPSIVFRELQIIEKSNHVFEVQVEITNVGYLPTFITEEAKKLSWNVPLVAELETEGCTLLSPHHSRVEIGHLHGWGRGKHGMMNAPFWQRSSRVASSYTLRVLVHGSGHCTIRVRGERTGVVEQRVAVGALPSQGN